ncbi:H-NS histone family protein [Actimicrobium sp. CCI2.3]|uniref:H-NS histone family protein n=1 Tax=Actimicrobium sp. CCI2.3 TaxID=3048616 RepID=UPI003A0FE646
MHLEPQETKQTKSKVAVPAKYRDVATGKTWSGRGKKPLWLVNDLESCLIK